MNYLIALILALFVPTTLFGAVGTSPGNSGSAGSGVVNVQSNSTAIGAVTNINFVLGAGLTTSTITNNAASNRVDIALVVSGGSATNAIQLLNGAGTNTTFSSLTIGTGAFTNSVTSTHSGSSTFSGGVTNTGIIRTTGGITHTAGVTNTAHLRMTGWTENSGLVTNTAPTYSTAGVTVSTGGLTNTAHFRNTGWTENSGLVTNTAPTYSTAGVTISTGGLTNSAHLRMTGWTEHSAGVTNISNVASHQAAPLLISGSLNLMPITNASLAISQVTNAYAIYVTNANLTFTFAGTPLSGARGQVDIVNTADTNIVVTWPLSWSVAQSATVTSFIASSNSITEVFWYHLAGTNRIRVATKEIIENFTAPAPGQVVAFHDAHTKTNVTLAGTGDVTASANFAVDNVAIRSDGTGKGVQRSGIVIDDSDNIRANSITTTNYISGTIFTNAGATVLQTTLAVTGASALAGNVTATNIDVGAVKLTNNVTYMTANLVPVSEGTNFWADFMFAARTYLMTNAFWLSSVTNVTAANHARGWAVSGRNLSGGALRVGVASGFRRSGTNNVSVGNNQNFMLTVWPDGTGGVDVTNFNAQIILFDSP
jgi:hypothetical protein